MAPQPPRREQRRTHLDASVVPVERALLARAGAIEAHAEDRRSVQASGLTTLENPVMLDRIAAEFRLLAEELHWH